MENSSTNANTQPLVSVVISSYNHEKFIEESVRSVVNSNYKNLEIIVVDSNSTDNSLNIIKSIKDERIKVISLEKNFGPSNTTNEGFKVAKGKYIAILASDDIAMPDRFNKQVEFLESNNDYGIVFSKPYVFSNNNLFPNKIVQYIFRKVFTTENRDINSWLKFLFENGNCLCAPSAMIKKEVIEKIGLMDINSISLQDYDYWIRALLAGFNIYILPTPLVKYRVHGNNLSLSDTCIFSFEINKVYELYNQVSKEKILEIFPSSSYEFKEFIEDKTLLLAMNAIKSDKIVLQKFGMQLLYSKYKNLNENINGIYLFDIIKKYVLLKKKEKISLIKSLAKTTVNFLLMKI